jgi:hypothetical protein
MSYSSHMVNTLHFLAPLWMEAIITLATTISYSRYRDSVEWLLPT